jgi:hypothetical protein
MKYKKIKLLTAALWSSRFNVAQRIGRPSPVARRPSRKNFTYTAGCKHVQWIYFSVPTLVRKNTVVITVCDKISRRCSGVLTETGCTVHAFKISVRHGDEWTASWSSLFTPGAPWRQPGISSLAGNRNSSSIKINEARTFHELIWPKFICISSVWDFLRIRKKIITPFQNRVKFFCANAVCLHAKKQQMNYRNYAECF